MPAEILNQLESLVPKTKASVPDKSIGSSAQSEPLDILKSEMRAMKFTWNLPIIANDDLRWDERSCGLCNRKYDEKFKVCGRGESPCCLPCGHIAGHQCLRKHLSPYESGFTRCPFSSCSTDFPQMFTDPVEPKQPTSDLAWVSVDEIDSPDEELSRQVSQLSMDSGASSYEVKRFLSLNEVLARSRSESEESSPGTEIRDFDTEATGPPDVGEGEFPKDRRMGRSLNLAPATAKAVGLIARNF